MYARLAVGFVGFALLGSGSDGTVRDALGGTIVGSLNPDGGSRSSSTLLVIGHPGHELRVWGWVTSLRPLVSILTDGSGSTGHPRLAVTQSSLERAGARPEAPFGALTDQAVYTALLTGEYTPLLIAAQDLADTIVSRRVTRVAADAIEGYNPTHDVCGMIAGAAVAAAASRGQPATALEFAVTDVPGVDEAPVTGVLRLELSDADLAAKVELARAYARASGPMLEAEVDALLARHGHHRFRTETLVPSSGEALSVRFANAAPYYETHGARRVHEGKYDQVLRMEDHLIPFERRLTQWIREAP